MNRFRNFHRSEPWLEREDIWTLGNGFEVDPRAVVPLRQQGIFVNCDQGGRPRNVSGGY